MYSAYSAKLSNFIAEEPNSLIGRLQLAIAKEGFGQQWNSQTFAWQEEIEILQRVGVLLIQSVPEAQSWLIFLEYEIARRGRRIDAVLLMNSAVVVLEFKVGLDRGDSTARWQAYEYALDLRDFHSASIAAAIIPILVPTAMPASPTVIPEWIGARVCETIECCPNELASTLVDINEATTLSSMPMIDQEAWRNASYKPSLSIIEAAEKIFAGHEVREIAHSTATNLTETVGAVIRVIREAQENDKHIVCFVTGVPGAGKTLVGLSAVHDPALRKDDRPAAVFLSGNGPLVKIVTAALFRDRKKRKGNAKDAKREVNAFIQNVHSFLNAYTVKSSAGIPSEHVVVFDEAQRAWNGDRMALKKRGSRSEAALMLEVMARCPGWAVIVALIGFGQEIHQGEAGLREWGRAITEDSSTWNVVASPSVLSQSADDAEVGLFEDVSLFPGSLERDPALHLTVSVRSSRARMVGQWVGQLLEGNWQNAAKHFAGNREFPVVLTRDLGAAREWLSSRTNGQAGGCGLLASSGALRLRAHGIEVSSSFRQGYQYEEWFLGGSMDVRSSSMLEVAATEFECQGLELDWVGVCWAGDFLYDSETSQWVARRFVGSRWQNVKKATTRQFILNKYRVLLTRARKGLVIWLPTGSELDVTRDCKGMDATAEFLLNCGLQSL